MIPVTAAPGGLFEWGGEIYNVNPNALLHAVQQASVEERRTFERALGSGWMQRHGGLDRLTMPGLEEAAELMSGGSNRRFNSNEKNIRAAGARLLSLYPMPGTAAPVADTGAPPAGMPGAGSAPPPGAPPHPADPLAAVGGVWGAAALGLAAVLLLRGRK